MKKNILISVILLVTLGLTACSGSKNTGSSGDYISEAEKQIPLVKHPLFGSVPSLQEQFVKALDLLDDAFETERDAIRATANNDNYEKVTAKIKEFDKEQVLSFIKRKCNVPEQKNVFNENTVKKDIRVLLQNYLAPTSPKGYEEYASILLELGLLRENEGKYSFNEISIEQVNPLIILFALVHIAGEDKTVSFDKLQELSLIFCIPTSSFLMVVRSLSEQYPKEISYTDNSGIRNVQFLQKLNILEVLNRYYNNDEI